MVITSLLGRFIWGGKNVTQSCRNLQLCKEGPSRLPILRANLQNQSSEFVAAQCHLDEHIVNINGELLFKPNEGVE
jgi:hypothetical protein